jgi:hypothetical protein
MMVIGYNSVYRYQVLSDFQSYPPYRESADTRRDSDSDSDIGLYGVCHCTVVLSTALNRYRGESVTNQTTSSVLD